MSDDSLYVLTHTGQALDAWAWTPDLVRQEIADAIGAPGSAIQAVRVVRDPVGVSVQLEIRMAEVSA